MNDEPKPIDLDALGLDPVDDYFYPPSEIFLVKNPGGRWLPLRKKSYEKILISRGLNHRTDGQPMSDVDLEIIRVMMENDLSRHGPLCGKNAGFFESDGIRILVTEDMNLIEPRKGSMLTIKAVLYGLFQQSENQETGLAQMHTFLAWLKSSAEALRAGRQQQQQALAICGPADCGKSFVQHNIITPCLAGRSADANRYFLKGNDFNSDLFKAEHLTLDDSVASTSIRDRIAFGQRIKEHTTGATVKGCHGKGLDQVHLRPWWRISITVNDDPEAMLVLPPLNEDFSDKMILLRASQFTFPDPNTTSDEKERFLRKMQSEIPAFLHWLLYEYQVPEQYVDKRRYNVVTYHHPELKSNLESLSPEYELLDLIDLVMEHSLKTGAVWITAENLEENIRSSYHRRAELIFTYRGACAKYLQRLSNKQPKRVQKHRKSEANGWMIHPKE